ncbi:hypothetical protein [Halomonas salina]|uniref:DUF1449 family protein n=1 Tax=Halomonas salina TaxID=42565 RepID=A0ABR4WS83_9GAMM|nr:hypothetical protein [Halomonas salina]KGE77580.1 hypothetical protein FP66_09055 [Halomonas salina]
MNAIASLALSFPLIFFTALLALVAVYWLLVLVRLAPVELFEHDSLRNDTLASALVSLGFAGVPASLALSALIVLASLLAWVVELAVLGPLSLGFFRVPLGLAVIWGAFALASPLSAALCRRLHRRLHRHPSLSKRCLLGERVRVLDADAGGATAEMVDDPGRQVRLRGKAGNRPHVGEVRVLVKYLVNDEAYRSVPEQDYLDARTRLVRLHLVERHEGAMPRQEGRHGSRPSA